MSFERYVVPAVVTALLGAFCLLTAADAVAHRGGYGPWVPPGHVIHGPLPGAYPLHVHGHPYYYHQGVFYRPRGSGAYVVVSAPIGARVPMLPPGYVTIGVGPHDYFYLNATFFLWDAATREYVVVEKPEQAEEAVAAAESSPRELFVYPTRGQNEATARRDRYECHLWAVEQTGIDPSMGATSDVRRSDYSRALTACLEGRGYTVR